MITILTIGKLKEDYWKKACEEYIKRLSPYLKIKIIEIPETPFHKKNTIEEIQKEEAKKITRQIKPDSYVIGFDLEGKSCTSEEFAKKFSAWKNRSDLIFIIGGPLGLHIKIKTSAHEKISLSPLTFTHQMTRVILLEQLYRGIMMEKGKYHY